MLIAVLMMYDLILSKPSTENVFHDPSVNITTLSTIPIRIYTDIFAEAFYIERHQRHTLDKILCFNVFTVSRHIKVVRSRCDCLSVIKCYLNEFGDFSSNSRIDSESWNNSVIFPIVSINPKLLHISLNQLLKTAILAIKSGNSRISCEAVRCKE